MDSKNLWAATQQVVDHAIQANRTGQVLMADFIRRTPAHLRLAAHCTVCLSLGRRSGLTQAALSRALEIFPTRCLYTAPEYPLTPEFRAGGPQWDILRSIVVPAGNNWGRALYEACRGRMFADYHWPELAIVDHLVNPGDRIDREMTELLPMAQDTNPDHPFTVLILQ